MIRPADLFLEIGKKPKGNIRGGSGTPLIFTIDGPIMINLFGMIFCLLL
jgi:hypothetical protein